MTRLCLRAFELGDSHRHAGSPTSNLQPSTFNLERLLTHRAADCGPPVRPPASLTSSAARRTFLPKPE